MIKSGAAGQRVGPGKPFKYIVAAAAFQKVGQAIPNDGFVANPANNTFDSDLGITDGGGAGV